MSASHLRRPPRPHHPISPEGRSRGLDDTVEGTPTIRGGALPPKAPRMPSASPPHREDHGYSVQRPVPVSSSSTSSSGAPLPQPVSATTSSSSATSSTSTSGGVHLQVPRGNGGGSGKPQVPSTPGRPLPQGRFVPKFSPRPLPDLSGFDPDSDEESGSMAWKEKTASAQNSFCSSDDDGVHDAAPRCAPHTVTKPLRPPSPPMKSPPVSRVFRHRTEGRRRSGGNRNPMSSITAAMNSAMGPGPAGMSPVPRRLSLDPNDDSDEDARVAVGVVRRWSREPDSDTCSNSGLNNSIISAASDAEPVPTVAAAASAPWRQDREDAGHSDSDGPFPTLSSSRSLPVVSGGEQTRRPPRRGSRIAPVPEDRDGEAVDEYFPERNGSSGFGGRGARFHNDNDDGNDAANDNDDDADVGVVDAQQRGRRAGDKPLAPVRSSGPLSYGGIRPEIAAHPIMAMNRTASYAHLELARERSGSFTALALHNKLPSPLAHADRPDAADSGDSTLLEREFHVIGRLGSGSFSDVFHVVCREDHRAYAVKMSRRQYRGRKDRQAMLQEVRNFKVLGVHPHVVTIHSAWTENGHLFIQMELCERGSLMNLLADGGVVEEPVVWEWLVDIALGLHHIHAQQLVHMDIKPDNIYLSADGRLKIGDLGIAVKEGRWEDGLEGDSTYLAPELLADEKEVRHTVDIFSLGCTMLEIAANVELPTGGAHWQRLRKGHIEFPPHPQRSADLRDIVRHMMSPNPRDRPDASDILAHPRCAAILARRRAHGVDVGDGCGDAAVLSTHRGFSALDSSSSTNTSVSGGSSVHDTSHDSGHDSSREYANVSGASTIDASGSGYHGGIGGVSMDASLRESLPGTPFAGADGSGGGGGGGGKGRKTPGNAEVALRSIAGAVRRASTDAFAAVSRLVSPDHHRSGDLEASRQQDKQGRRSNKSAMTSRRPRVSDSAKRPGGVRHVLRPSASDLSISDSDESAAAASPVFRGEAPVAAKNLMGDFNVTASSDDLAMSDAASPARRLFSDTMTSGPTVAPATAGGAGNATTTATATATTTTTSSSSSSSSNATGAAFANANANVNRYHENGPSLRSSRGAGSSNANPHQMHHRHRPSTLSNQGSAAAQGALRFPAVQPTDARGGRTFLAGGGGASAGGRGPFYGHQSWQSSGGGLGGRATYFGTEQPASGAQGQEHPVGASSGNGPTARARRRSRRVADLPAGQLRERAGRASRVAAGAYAQAGIQNPAHRSGVAVSDDVAADSGVSGLLTSLAATSACLVAVLLVLPSSLAAVPLPAVLWLTGLSVAWPLARGDAGSDESNGGHASLNSNVGYAKVGPNGSSHVDANGGGGDVQGRVAVTRLAAFLAVVMWFAGWPWVAALGAAAAGVAETMTLRQSL